MVPITAKRNRATTPYRYTLSSAQIFYFTSPEKLGANSNLQIYSPQFLIHFNLFSGENFNPWHSILSELFSKISLRFYIRKRMCQWTFSFFCFSLLSIVEVHSLVSSDLKDTSVHCVTNFNFYARERSWRWR